MNMKQLLIDQDSMSAIDTVLDNFFNESIQEATTIDPAYEHLWRNLQTLVRSGGKRLRPQMVLMAYAAFGGKDSRSIAPIAVAQELLHVSLLIHDDIIDRDYIRYGIDNIAGSYRRTYAAHVSEPDDLVHYSHSAAILAGDLLLSGAHRLIATSNLPAKSIAIAQQLLSVGVFEVAGGELLDTEFSFVPYTNGGALKVARYKTASYSFIAPLLTGASLAGASRDQQAKLKNYATSLGIAYQLVDDVLGIFGDEAQTGKSIVSDIVEGKRTYLVEIALNTFSPNEQTVFMAAFNNSKATQSEIEAAKHLLEQSGARQKTEQKITEYADNARSALDLLKLPQAHYQLFLDMITKTTNRVS